MQRQLQLYEKAAVTLEDTWREMRRVAKVRYCTVYLWRVTILEPWHLTAEFIEVHKNAQGTAAMKLTRLGDPSGWGEAYNFLREVDVNPNKGTGNSDGALKAQIKNSGTEKTICENWTWSNWRVFVTELRHGAEKEIDTLSNVGSGCIVFVIWVQAASDGIMGDRLERHARGEKMKLSDQRQMYREQIQEIWRRQRTTLGTSSSTTATGEGGVLEVVTAIAAVVPEPNDVECRYGWFRW